MPRVPMPEKHLPPWTPANPSVSQGLEATGKDVRYPTGFIDVWISPFGERFTLRPVLPQDAPLLCDLFERLSAVARHYRFQGLLQQLPAPTLERMSRVDYQHEFAIVLTTTIRSQEVIVADARFVVDDDGLGAEFGIVVDDAWQRRGLGARAMRALVNAAGSADLQWLHGTVLSSNHAMLALMRRSRFCCTPDAEDDLLVNVEARLTPPSLGAAEPARSPFFPLLARWRAAARRPVAQ